MSVQITEKVSQAFDRSGKVQYSTKISLWKVLGGEHKPKNYERWSKSWLSLAVHRTFNKVVWDLEVYPSYHPPPRTLGPSQHKKRLWTMENTWQGILVLTFYTVLGAMLRIYFVHKLHFVFCFCWRIWKNCFIHTIKDLKEALLVDPVVSISSTARVYIHPPNKSFIRPYNNSSIY